MEKRDVQGVLDSFPERIDLDAFVERLVLKQKIEAGEADIAAGKVTTNDEAKKRLDRWLE